MGQNGRNDALWEGCIAKIGSKKSYIWNIQRKIYLCGTSWAHMQVVLYKWLFSCLMIKPVPIFRKQPEQLVLYLYMLMKSGVRENTFIPQKYNTFYKCPFFGNYNEFWLNFPISVWFWIPCFWKYRILLHLSIKSGLNERYKCLLSTKVTTTNAKFVCSRRFVPMNFQLWYQIHADGGSVSVFKGGLVESSSFVIKNG